MACTHAESSSVVWPAPRCRRRQITGILCAARENSDRRSNLQFRLRFVLITTGLTGVTRIDTATIKTCHQRSSPIGDAPQWGFGGLTARQSHPDPSLRPRPWSQQPPRHCPRLRAGYFHHDRPDRRAPIPAAGPRARPDTPAGCRSADPADRLRRRAVVRARASTSISTRSSFAASTVGGRELWTETVPADLRDAGAGGLRPASHELLRAPAASGSRTTRQLIAHRDRRRRARSPPTGRRCSTADSLGWRDFELGAP